MSQPNAYDAVMRFLLDAANDDNALFIRTLFPEDREIAREYLRGLAEHARLRKSVPVPSEPAR